MAPGGRKLRLGLFVDGGMQPRALVDAFAGTAISDHAEIVVIALANRPRSRPRSARPRTAAPLAWRAYSRFDRWLSHASADASKPVDIVATLAPEQVMSVPDQADGRTVIENWRASIAGLRLDVAFMLGEIDEETIRWLAAKYGVWRFEFGADSHGSGGLEGFAEVAEGSAVTMTTLRCRISGYHEDTLYQSWFRTAPFSVSRNRDRILRRAAHFPARVLKALHQSGWEAMNAGRAPLEIDQRPSGTRRPVRSFAGIGLRLARRAVQKLCCVDQWFIGYRFGDGGANGQSFGRFSCLMPPQDRFWADPFPIERDGRYFIFFEEFVFSAGKGHLSVIEVDRNGTCSPPKSFLERPYHLSYPFLIEDEGQLFMVPETGEHGTVELFRCVHFPDRWVLEKVLLRAPYCVDATLHRSDGRWWMFVNIGNDDTDVHDELHIYHADGLRGEWTPHRANPVKSDVRSSRPAGRLYEFGGRLYRPAQIGAPLYGSGISINQVLILTPDEYLEHEVGRIVPPKIPGVLGVHTVNRAGDLIVVDGFARRRRLLPRRLDVFEPRYLRGAFATGNLA